MPYDTGSRMASSGGTIPSVTIRPAEAVHLRDLARLRRVRDRIDREFAQPLDVEALALGVHMSAGHLSRQFKLAYGESPYSYLMTRRIERNKDIAMLSTEDAESLQQALQACRSNA